jgi:hypothetical protein
VYVNDTFTIEATITNNSPRHILVDHSPCSYLHSVPFDKGGDGEVLTQAIGIACSAVAIATPLPAGGLLTAGKLNAFAIDLSNPQVMYTGGSAGGSASGTYKTTNGGAKWIQINKGISDPQINAIWLNQTNPNTLLVPEQGGIFRSTNGGLDGML